MLWTEKGYADEGVGSDGEINEGGNTGEFVVGVGPDSEKGFVFWEPKECCTLNIVGNADEDCCEEDVDAGVGVSCVAGVPENETILEWGGKLVCA